jgi:hypothetical protein
MINDCFWLGLLACYVGLLTNEGYYSIFWSKIQAKSAILIKNGEVKKS